LPCVGFRCDLAQDLAFPLSKLCFTGFASLTCFVEGCPFGRGLFATCVLGRIVCPDPDSSSAEGRSADPGNGGRSDDTSERRRCDYGTKER
jgi:hypothetical protein